MAIKIGTIVTVDSLGNDKHVVIGQASKGGYWVQNLRTGALPTKLYTGGGYRSINGHDVVTGFMPRELRETGMTHLSYASLACQSAGTNHSTDTVTHYSGSGTPEELCGYHALANTDWRVSA